MKKVLDILTTFKYSANVRNDYRNAEKLNGFYATASNTHILARMIDTVLRGNNKSVMISGAYGTGKSFLGSLLMALLGNCLDKKSLALLQKKIDRVSPDAWEICREANNGRYLIVFPNESLGNFSQALAVGIDEAFRHNKVKGTLNSAYQMIIDKIVRWEKSHKEFYVGLQKALIEHDIDLESFIVEIKAHNPRYYQLFEEIYPLFMGGEKFLPIGGTTNLFELLANVESIAKVNGFAGVVYVFDEFGRYLEKNITQLDVKEIQDAAEYCNSGANSALFLITHKDIFQYSKRIRLKEAQNEWEKVSGRFARTHLSYEPSNTLTIIRAILQKHESGFAELLSCNTSLFNEQALILESTALAAALQEINAYYPLAYPAAIALPRLSQKLAQNERTLFSFLCGDEQGSLIRLFKNDSCCVNFVTLDTLYDFFESNFKFLEPDSIEYKMYINARDVISRISDMDELKFIKALAVIYIINEFGELPPSEPIMASALAVSIEECRKIAGKLQAAGRVAFRKYLGHYVVARDLDFNIDLEVKKIFEKKLSVDIAALLTAKMPLGVEYPVIYNHHHKITRYFNQMFLNPDDIASLDLAFKDKNQDGLIVYVIDFGENSTRVGVEELSRVYRDAIFLSPCVSLECLDEILQLDALDKIQLTGDIALNSNSAKLEIYSYQEELLAFIERAINNGFTSASSFYAFKGGERTIIRGWVEYQNYLEQFLVQKYTNYASIPVINYELINKTVLTAPMRKVRRTILLELSSHSLTNEYFEKTGAENSVARILLRNTGIWQNSSIIFSNTGFDAFYQSVLSDLGQGASFDQLLARYSLNSSSYGIRTGVFTFIFGLILLANPTRICINYNGNEIEFSPDLLDALEAEPGKYYISLIEPSPRESELLTRLACNSILAPFMIPVNNQLLAVYNAFRAYVLSLPRSVIPSVPESHRTVHKLLEGLAINNSKAFFYRKLPAVYKADSLEKSLSLFEKDIEAIDTALLHVQRSIASAVLRSIQASDDSQIVSAIREWVIGLSDSQISDMRKSSLAELERLCTGDWQPDATQILKYITASVNGGIDYYYWRDPNDLSDFVVKFGKEIANIITSGQSDTILEDDGTPLSDLAVVLKDKLKSTIKGFGRSVNKQEIRNAIIQLIKEIN